MQMPRYARHDKRRAFFHGLLAVMVVLALEGCAGAQEQSAAKQGAAGQEGVSVSTVSFATEDGGVVYADVYGAGGGSTATPGCASDTAGKTADRPFVRPRRTQGKQERVPCGAGERGVVLAHGGRFNKGSWEPQARALAQAGFRVLAIDFRGYGESRGPGDKDVMSAPLHFDVLAAVRYLRETGVKSVAVVGGSMGGSAAADAAIAAPGEIDRVVLLGSEAGTGRVGPPEKLTVRKLFIVARDDASGSGPRLPRIREQFDRAPQPKELLTLDGSAHAQFLFETEQSDRLLREILRFLSAP